MSLPPPDHNNPPTTIEFTIETAAAINTWLTDHPIIDNEDDAREAKLYIDRAKNTLGDLEKERDELVRPLNLQVSDINARFKPARTTLERIRDILIGRTQDYAFAEEKKRRQIAEEARKAAEEAERRARAAEAAEQAAKEESASGVVVDIGDATRAADDSFAEYKAASRFAARAERETKVRISGGFNRSISLRQKETIMVTDPCKAIADMGLSPRVREAIETDARAYHKALGEWPEGIEIKTERRL